MEKNQDNLDLLRKISKQPKVSQRMLADELGFSLGNYSYNETETLDENHPVFTR